MADYGDIFVRTDAELEYEELDTHDGVTRTQVLEASDGLGYTVSRYELEPGAELFEHTDDGHLNYTVEGTYTATIEGEEFVMDPGDAILVEAGVPHGAFNHTDEPAAYLTLPPGIHSNR